MNYILQLPTLKYRHFSSNMVERYNFPWYK